MTHNTYINIDYLNKSCLVMYLPTMIIRPIKLNTYCSLYSPIKQNNLTSDL